MYRVTGKKIIGMVALAASLAITGCVTADDSQGKEIVKSEALKMADADFKAAKAASGQWRVIDKATGGKAVNLKKLLEVAHKKAEAGEAEEADRIAAHVSKAAKMGIDQAKRYSGATPYYN